MLYESLNNLFDILKDSKEYKMTSEGERTHSMVLKATINKKGELVGLVPFDKKTNQLIVPEMPGTPASGSGFAPQSGYSRRIEDAFGISDTRIGDLKKREKTKTRDIGRFSQWKELHDSSPSEDPSLKTFQKFLSDWSKRIESNTAEAELIRIGNYNSIEELPRGGGIVFAISGETRYLHDTPWAAELNKTDKYLKKDSKKQYIYCPILKQVLPLADIHPQIKTSPIATISSTNQDSFESYGNKGGEIVGISQEAADRYGRALNVLLSKAHSDDHRVTLGSIVVIFWTTPTLKVRTKLSELFNLSEDKKSQDKEALQVAKESLSSIKEGKTSKKDGKIHILGLLPNKGRSSVKFFDEYSIKDLEDKITKHEVDFQLPWEKTPKTPTIWRIREALGLREEEERTLFLAIINNRSYPTSISNKALTILKTRLKLSKKKRTEKDMNWERNQYILLKILVGWLKRNQKITEHMIKESTAYKLGQALQIMEACQLKIHSEGKSPNKGIVERFGASLCTRPSQSLASAIKLHRNHIKKLKSREDYGFATWAEKELSEILNGAGKIPSRHTKQEQAEFWIGYYSSLQK